MNKFGIGQPVRRVTEIPATTNPLGVGHIDMPATPSRVWAAMQRAQPNGR